MGLLLALVRRISDAAAAMRRGEWDRSASKAPSCAVRRWASWAWAASVVTSRSWRARSECKWSARSVLAAERAGEMHVRLLSLEALLRAADVVTLHVALTDQTHHLIDATRLKLMKRPPY